MIMKTPLHLLALGLAALFGTSTMAQYIIPVQGQVNDCTPGDSVRVQTGYGILPEQSVTVAVGPDCSYQCTFDITTPGGIFLATLICGSDTAQAAGTNWWPGWGAEEMVYMYSLECGGTPCEPPSLEVDFGNWDWGNSTICSTDSIWFTVETSGTYPDWVLTDGPTPIEPPDLGEYYHYVAYSAASGDYHFTVMNACGMADTVITIPVIQTPSAGSGGAAMLCDLTGPTDLASFFWGPADPDGTWTYSGSVHGPVFDPATDQPGTYTYTQEGVATCPDDVATVYIYDLPTWWADTDGDGLGDPNSSVQACDQPAGYVNLPYDNCPTVTGTIGSSCDDGNPLTINDALDPDCACTGTDTTLIDCLGLAGGSALPGTPCNEMVGGQIFYGVWDADCNCVADTAGCEAQFWAFQAYDSTTNWTVPLPNAVWVLNLSSGNAPDWAFLWDFGDGSTSTETWPTHAYDGPGPWQLCLTVFNGSCVDTHCDSLSMDANGMLEGMPTGGGHPVAHDGNRSGGFTLNVVPQIPGGIDELPGLAQLNLWPNPATDALNLSWVAAHSGQGTVQLLDLSGRTVQTTALRTLAGSNHLSLATDRLEPGLYLVQLELGGMRISQRFMKAE
jgi:hypothetical protein